MPPEARVVQQLNLSTLHLTWALELHQVGLVHEADAHSAEALERALEAEWSAAGPHRDVWAERARLFAACARTLGPDPLAGVSQVRRSLAALEPVGADYERAFSAPVLGLALAAAGLLVEGLLVVGQALAAAGPGADPVVLASTQRAQLVLMSSTSEGARAGLDLAETLSSALWRQRARRLSAAEALLRYEILQAEHEIVSRDSDVDALTGTAARRALDRRMATLSGRSDEERASVCVLVIDLDGLKTVNDSLGHLAGDLVLSVVGQALTGSLRGEDLVGRFGGDEFVALLCTEARDGAAVATRMLAAVRKVAWPDEFTVRPSMSIGLAVADADVRLDDALAAADGAMYLAKRSGGDTLRVADPRG
jgi:diguanylate cyclase (GGDEF)-like protein